MILVTHFHQFISKNLVIAQEKENRKYNDGDDRDILRFHEIEKKPSFYDRKARKERIIMMKEFF